MFPVVVPVASFFYLFVEADSIFSQHGRRGQNALARDHLIFPDNAAKGRRDRACCTGNC